MLATFLWVGAGGFLGSAARYGVAVALAGSPLQARFPLATFLVNLAGCAAIGLLAGLWERFPTLDAQLRLFLVTGVLGGFTTFSAFGLETIALLRQGQLALAALYAVGSVALGVLAVWLGFVLARP
jgi:fluoride exporter